MAEVTTSCMKCSKPIVVDIDSPKVMNYETFTLIVIPHSGEQLCPCGAVVIPSLVQLGGLGFAGVVVPPERQKRLVQPAKGGIA